jgi:hypothetical protein
VDCEMPIFLASAIWLSPFDSISRRKTSASEASGIGSWTASCFSTRVVLRVIHYDNDRLLDHPAGSPRLTNVVALAASDCYAVISVRPEP